MKIILLVLALLAPASSLAAEAQVFTPETYGAVGDCLADDTAALVAMRTAATVAQGDGSTNIVFRLATGRCYKYTNPRWTWGIRHLWIDGNDASLQNVANFNVCFSFCAYPIVFNRSVFEMQAPEEPISTTTAAQTFLMADAAVGDTQATLLSQGDAANFSPGARALVYSYDQQIDGGFPPNARYFDYVTVTSVVGAVVHFTPPLSTAHSASYPERIGAITGRARIYPYEKAAKTPWGVSLLVSHVNVIANPNALRPADMGYSDPAYRSHNYMAVQGFDTAVISDSRGEDLVLGTAGAITIQGGHYFVVTADKIINSITFSSTTVDTGVNECTGVKLMQFFNSSSGMFVCPPRRMLVVNHTFNTPTVVSPPSYDLNNSGFPGVVQIANSVFNGAGGASIPIGASPTESATVDGTTVLAVASGIQADVTVQAMQLVLRCVTPGGRVGLVHNGVETTGTVAGITGTYAGPNLATIALAGLAQPVVGDTVRCRPVAPGGVSAQGNTYNNYGGPPVLP